MLLRLLQVPGWNEGTIHREREPNRDPFLTSDRDPVFIHILVFCFIISFWFLKSTALNMISWITDFYFGGPWHFASKVNSLDSNSNDHRQRTIELYDFKDPSSSNTSQNGEAVGVAVKRSCSGAKTPLFMPVFLCSAIYKLCDLGKIAKPLWASVFP